MIKVDTAATGEVVTLKVLKDHLHILAEDTLEDGILSLYLAAAVSYTEEYLNRFLLPTTVTEYFDCFDNVICLKKNPVTEVASLKYLNADNTEKTLTVNTDFYTDLVSEPARIAPVDSWPVTSDRLNSVYVNYVTGYEDATKIPTAIKQAILLITGQMYRDKEDDILRLITRRDILASHRLLDLYRVKTYVRA